MFLGQQFHMNLVILIVCQDSQNEIPSAINMNPDMHVLVGSFAACVTAPHISLLRLLLLRNWHLCAGYHGVET